MEFKLRAIDTRPAPYHSPSPPVSHFSDHPFRDGFPDAGFRNPAVLFHNPNDFHEAIRWEIEKEQIREEIIVEEIARRRMFEAEVRREMMIEREMAMRMQAGIRLSFEERMVMQFEERFAMMNGFDNRLFEERMAFHGISSFEQMQMPMLPAPLAPEVMPVPEVNKDKVIFLAKPTPSLCGAKRKAATATIGLDEAPSITSKKKPKEEWSCAICQVSATSEKGLIEHLNGKKHKAKEAGLRYQMTCKNSMTAPNLDRKPTNLTELGSKLVETSQGTVTSNNQKLNFWCEICQIGAYSVVAHKTHLKGKKHMARLQGLGQKDSEQATAAITNASASSSDSSGEQDYGTWLKNQMQKNQK